MFGRGQQRGVAGNFKLLKNVAADGAFNNFVGREHAANGLAERRHFAHGIFYDRTGNIIAVENFFQHGNLVFSLINVLFNSCT